MTTDVTSESTEGNSKHLSWMHNASCFHLCLYHSFAKSLQFRGCQNAAMRHISLPNLIKLQLFVRRCPVSRLMIGQAEAVGDNKAERNRSIDAVHVYTSQLWGHWAQQVQCENYECDRGVLLFKLCEENILLSTNTPLTNTIAVK